MQPKQRCGGRNVAVLSVLGPRQGCGLHPYSKRYPGWGVGVRVTGAAARYSSASCPKGKIFSVHPDPGMRQNGQWEVELPGWPGPGKP